MLDFQGVLFMSSIFAVAQGRQIALQVVHVPGAALGKPDPTNQKPHSPSKKYTSAPCLAEWFVVVEL